MTDLGRTEYWEDGQTWGRKRLWITHTKAALLFGALLQSSVAGVAGC